MAKKGCKGKPVLVTFNDKTTKTFNTITEVSKEYCISMSNLSILLATNKVSFKLKMLYHIEKMEKI